MSFTCNAGHRCNDARVARANGLGSYASGTLTDTLTRRYHGLFVAALEPPLGRRVLLNKFDASVLYGGTHIDLSSTGGTTARLRRTAISTIVDVHLDGRVPVWTYAFADALLERRIWMEPGAQITYVEWRVRDASGPIDLTLKAYVNDRDYHALTRAHDVANVAQVDGDLATLCMGAGATWYLRAAGAQLEPAAQWYYGFRYDAETERGLDDTEDLYHALTIRVQLPEPEATLLVRIALDADDTAPSDPHERERALLALWRAAHPRMTEAPEWAEQLVLAADAFIVARDVDGAPGSTVIAGYHWFGDWGRDTMIALPGLTLATGRPEIARSICKPSPASSIGACSPIAFPTAALRPNTTRSMRRCGTSRPCVPITRQRAIVRWSTRSLINSMKSSIAIRAGRGTVSSSILATGWSARANPACISPGWMQRSATGWLRHASASASKSMHSGTTRCARWIASRKRLAAIRRAIASSARERVHLSSAFGMRSRTIPTTRLTARTAAMHRFARTRSMRPPCRFAH